jgi:small-conductance mechanosensitive channel/CRP-like cAMP-binding protein
MIFLQGNLALVLGVMALVITLLIRRFAAEETLRRDLVGSVVLFGVYVVLREGGEALRRVVPEEWEPFIRVTWMLAFAYGALRLLVALLLSLRRRLRPGPTAKIQRDVLDFILYVICTIPILKTQLKIDVTTLLGTSAVLSLVLGFALQDTLSNLFAGLSLQLERPFGVGDFIKVGEHEGRVVQIAWRSTRLETVRRELVNFPNSEIAKAHLVSFSSGPLVAIDLTVSASYQAAPNLVKAEILETLREAPLVLAEPAPWVRVLDFAESAVSYQVRLFISNIADKPHVRDEVLSRLWYRFQRAGIEIPFPQRVVHLKQLASARPRVDTAAMLSKLELFTPFPPEELRAIDAAASSRHFGAGEEIVTEGRAGSTFYVVMAGALSVRVGQPGREVATLGPGEAFGEMSLLTGEPRSATVVAVEDVWLLELDRDAFARHFSKHPERAAQLAELLERRRSALVTAASDGPDRAETRPRVIDRLREIFRLR